MMRIFVFALMLATPLTSVLAAEPVGKTLAAKKIVRAAGDQGKRVLEPGADIFFMDRISTSGTGLGEFQFSDGTKLAVGPLASIVVDEFIAKGKSSYKKFGLAAAKGSFRWISGRSASSAYSIETPRGTMGIRGTVLDFTLRYGRVYVALVSGKATFCGGSCQTLRNPCDFIEVRGGNVSEAQPVASAFSSRRAAAGIFPFLGNPRQLSAPFRAGGSACLSGLPAEDPRRQDQGLREGNKGSEIPPDPTPPRSPLDQGGGEINIE